LPEITDNDLTFCQTSRRCWYVLNLDGDWPQQSPN
jgi:hypothetical protein